MEYTTLGDTGMSVSRICLGCMSFGLDTSEKYEWTLGTERSERVIERAIELGINFFDTANSYSWGDSERVLGSVLSEYDRDEFVVGSKVFHGAMDDPYPNATGLSRKTVEQELENSLDRLRMDTLDIYQIHRWDYDTPIGQTLRVLDDAVRRNQVRYLGASAMWAHQLAEALQTSERLDLDRFATMQNHYNIVYREEEREVLPLCEREGISVIPFSPLARGYAARPHEKYESTERGSNDAQSWSNRLAIYRAGGGIEINRRIEELAIEKGVKMAQIALAWLLHQDSVDAPIIGTTSVEQLEDAVEAINISLSDSDIEYLEQPYEPVPVVGHK